MIHLYTRFTKTSSSLLCFTQYICEIHGENSNKEWLDGVTDHASESSHSTSASVDNSGKDIRIALMRYFSHFSMTCAVVAFASFAFHVGGIPMSFL